VNAAWPSFLAFGLACASLMGLAFGPAWREWRRPTDSQPLPVSLSYTSDIDHFAEVFRETALATIAGGTPVAGSAFAIVPARIERMDWAAAVRPLLSFNPIRATGEIECKPPLYVIGRIETDAGASFSALYVQGAIRLGPGSEIAEWAYAEDIIHLGQGCIALRRISSAVAVELDRDCCFERINAPVVRFGLAHGLAPGRMQAEPVEASLSTLAGAVRRSDSLCMVNGDCDLPPSRLFRGSLVVTGRLTIGASTRIIGDVKARKGVFVGPGARIVGALTSEKDIMIQDGAVIRGPVVSETEIQLGTGAVIGGPDNPTTVSAESIYAEAGAVAHGTVWARDLGIVWST